nr:hypothetical protein Iba_chr03aCG4440 [Ipomoea batatas]
MMVDRRRNLGQLRHRPTVAPTTTRSPASTISKHRATTGELDGGEFGRRLPFPAAASPSFPSSVSPQRSSDKSWRWRPAASTSTLALFVFSFPWGCSSYYSSKERVGECSNDGGLGLVDGNHLLAGTADVGGDMRIPQPSLPHCSSSSAIVGRSSSEDNLSAHTDSGKNRVTPAQLPPLTAAVASGLSKPYKINTGSLH